MPSNFLLFLLDTFQSKGRKISWRQIRLQHLRGLPGGFLLLVKNRADFCSTHNTQLLEEFFARTELLALVGVGFPLFSRPLLLKKRPRYSQAVLCSCAGFMLLAGPSSPLSNSLFIYSFEIGFLWTMPAIFPVFRRSFTKASNTLFASVKAASAIMEKLLLYGGDRRKRSMAALIDFLEVLL